ncbi:MAG TPA: hypothetical protein ENJ42_04725 [Hellea balneolensis]|uniref:Uncharacterized protein n=1 Tax=Hellea balneolensis TaxID=287478 RepID=A0A7C5QPB7_9PROT|nr:hypothetical protein [Hellea balneolensis]
MNIVSRLQNCYAQMQAGDIVGAERKWTKPHAGALVLFPSYMWHGTVPLKGSHTRTTLPIDVVPK